MKIMNMNNALHPRDSVARLYLPRKIGGRGLIQVEDCVDQTVLGLEAYVSASEERLLVAARGGAERTSESVEEFKRRRREDRLREFREKALHGQYLRQTDAVASKESWTWLQKGFLKETEGLILAAQDQALRTDAIKAKIDRSQKDSGCRLCKKVDETISHLVCECEKLAQKEYKRRHDKVALALHWDLCRKYDFECGSKWYEHVPEGVLESADVKILWDFTIQTDHVIQARRPDIVVVDKESWHMSDY